jgi:hypothetical protein
VRAIATKRFIERCLAAILAATALGQATRAGSDAAAADSALVLAVDVSQSVDGERYALQLEGIAKAFEDRDVEDTLVAGPHRATLVALVEWSDKASLAVPWTLIRSRADAEAFADRVRRTPRAASDFTCMSTALELIGGKVLPFLPVPATRAIIDVSGDGHDNCNPAVTVDVVRDRLVASGVTINGLPILEGDEADTLEDWYRNHVIGGPSAFLVPARGFGDFERAIRRKFLGEISLR